MAFALNTPAVAARAGARKASAAERPSRVAALAARRAAPRAAAYRLYTAAELESGAPRPEAEAAAVPQVPSAAKPSAPPPAFAAAAAMPPPAAAAAPSGGFLGPAQELMNGRAAMLGFLIAVGVELSTGKGVTCQLFDDVVVKTTLVHTHGLDAVSCMSFAAVVLMTTMASLAPVMLGSGGAEDKARSVGPFTPAAELQNARAAMMGFVALLAVEGVKGSALF